MGGWFSMVIIPTCRPHTPGGHTDGVFQAIQQCPEVLEPWLRQKGQGGHSRDERRQQHLKTVANNWGVEQRKGRLMGSWFVDEMEDPKVSSDWFMGEPIVLGMFWAYFNLGNTRRTHWFAGGWGFGGFGIEPSRAGIQLLQEKNKTWMREVFQ